MEMGVVGFWVGTRVGASVVGATVVGAAVVGATVEGAAVVVLQNTVYSNPDPIATSM